jgi:hypothetical protein
MQVADTIIIASDIVLEEKLLNAVEMVDGDKHNVHIIFNDKKSILIVKKSDGEISARGTYSFGEPKFSNFYHVFHGAQKIMGKYLSFVGVGSAHVTVSCCINTTVC